MLANSTEWDLQKIDNILPFHKHEVLQIKPSICSAPYELVWLKTASCIYTAKSGYKAQSKLMITEETHAPETNHDWLANVWKLKTPEKIKLFLWNSLDDALPVGEQFARRNIPLASRCSLCNEVQSIAHMLFTCDYAKKVWSLAPLASSFDPSSSISTVGPGTLPASISWNLWISWNQLTFQKLDFTPEETLLKAIRDAREWTLPQDQPPKPQSNPTRIAQDPTLDPIRTYIAWIIDDAGSSSSHSVTDTFVASPLMAENLALQHAINSAVHHGITSLLILSDSQTLIKLVNSKGRHLEIATLLNDISLISTLFNSVRFKFIPRLDNIRADYVAKHALLMYQT
ncbi:hypothetical protein Bca52824_094033 [Brassica carinata]|uniref:RNase H type-1 domain-containing protein n=1 Tax=Brassica carinata TaxID=52824 RepID=A0A8X7P1E6_BRACI|nr:hypothetical protein Bca52824_094033 [Brassica carinata]